jgi:NAD(P)-dependent dehydrogenase (short-subunit alcohol dehydrogenase family)
MQEQTIQCEPATCRLAGKIAMVVGASRGLGHGIAAALADAGADVVAVSRTEGAPDAATVRWELADAADAEVPTRLLGRYDPDVVVIVAGTAPPMRPLQQHSWESFSAAWDTDVRITFHWLREILQKPLRPGARVVVISSGAALHGSPLSGGYAGAKATQRLITAYAQGEARRAGLDITFAAVLPRFSPQTGVGRPAVEAYAARSGQSVEVYLDEVVRTGGPLVTPEGAGAALVGLVTQYPADVAPAYLLSGDGLKQLP